MDRILNVGCGKETYGTDFVDFYPLRPEVIECNIDQKKLPYGSNTFDIVYSRCVFEHLTSPLFVLREMHRVLKPGGRLVLITDNAGFWAYHTPFSGTHYGEYEKLSGNLEDRHYSLFTTWHLENFARKAGFSNFQSFLINLPEFHSGFVVKLGSFVLRIVGFKRMAYPNVCLEASK